MLYELLNEPSLSHLKDVNPETSHHDDSVLKDKDTGENGPEEGSNLILQL